MPNQDQHGWILGLVYDLIASVESSKSNAIVLAPMDEMTKVMGSIAEIEIEANKAKYRAIFSQLDGSNIC